MAIISIGIGNVLVLLRVLVLWQDDKVRPAWLPPRELHAPDPLKFSQEDYTTSLGRVLRQFYRNDVFDVLHLRQGAS